MASEILAVPEKHLADVIKIIRAGLKTISHTVHKEVNNQLHQWCLDEEEYLNRINKHGTDETPFKY